MSETKIRKLVPNVCGSKYRIFRGNTLWFAQAFCFKHDYGRRTAKNSKHNYGRRTAKNSTNCILQNTATCFSRSTYAAILMDGLPSKWESGNFLKQRNIIARSTCSSFFLFSKINIPFLLERQVHIFGCQVDNIFGHLPFFSTGFGSIRIGIRHRIIRPRNQEYKKSGNSLPRRQEIPCWNILGYSYSYPDPTSPYNVVNWRWKNELVTSTNAFSSRLGTFWWSMPMILRSSSTFRGRALDNDMILSGLINDVKLTLCSMAYFFTMSISSA